MSEQGEFRLPSENFTNSTMTFGSDSRLNWTRSFLTEQFWTKELVSMQRLAGLYLIAYRVLLNLPATIACLIYGPLSNRIGRKWIMLIPCFGAVVACVWFGCSLIPLIRPIPEAAVFVLMGALFYGLCGKSNAMSMGANSYITDLSSTEERTKLLGRLLGVNCFGLCIGSGLLAVFYRYKGFPEVLIFAASSNIFVMLTLIFCVGDSREVTTQPILNAPKSKPNIFEMQPTSGTDNCDHAEDETPSQPSNKCSSRLFRSAKHSYDFLFKQRLGNLRAVLLVLMGSVLFNQMTKSGEQDAILLFVTNKPFHWTAEIYGYYLTVYYGCMATLLTLILPLIETWFKPYDTTLIVIGLAFKTARLLTMGLTNSTILLFISAVGGSAAGFISSGTRSLVSKLVHGDDVGASFALISCMESLANLFGGSLFTGIYNATITVFPGTVFLMDSVLHAAMLGAFIWIRVVSSQIDAQVTVVKS
ncbi:Proton-coupled folate transporter [Paragonimus heterotremus]|uniref:Proton-coupled folate transporter n=1 Tax=Paragonimus heterotremus TaxID=100268 RepID=A0A8J4WJB4_9TREM|nr:Proton-coupled folate transporter [Paragonimus heterotremus]